MRTATVIVNSCIWKMIVDEIGEVHKSSRSQMFFKIGVIENSRYSQKNTYVGVSF